MRPWRRRLLVSIVVFLAVFPILIFATDATQRGPLVTARHAALMRANSPEAQLSDSARRERQILQRRRIRPTLATAALGMTVQLFWLAVIGIVGRRWFGLRL